MSHNNEEVNRNRPCPICGKTDYCSFYHTPEGYELVVCKRSAQKEDVAGTDGRVYKFIGVSKEQQNLIYQEIEAYTKRREKEKDDWMREHQVGPYNPKKKGYKKPEQKSEPKPKSLAAVEPVQWTEVDKIEPRSHAELAKIYDKMLDHLVLDPMHRQYLLREGWTDEMIELHKLRSFPARDFVRFKFKNGFYSKNPYRKTLAKQLMESIGEDNLLGIPGAYVDDAGNWTFAGPSGILFPLYDAAGNKYGFSIRMDFCDPEIQLKISGNQRSYTHKGETWYLEPFKGFYMIQDGKRYFPKNGGYYKTSQNGTDYFKEFHGKYRPLTSFYQKNDPELYEKRLIVNSYDKGCQKDSGISVYFDPHKDNPLVCFLIEGEKKGIFANYYMQAPFVSFPGVDSWSSLFHEVDGKRTIDYLKEYGTKLFIVMYDADKEHNANVMRAQNNVIEALVKEGFKVGVGEWNSRYGKGLDDILAKGYLPNYSLI